MFCTYSKHNLSLKRIQKNHISLGDLFVKQGLVLKLGKVYNFKNKYYLEIAIIQILLRRNIFLTVVFKNIIVVLSRLKIALVFRLKKNLCDKNSFCIFWKFQCLSCSTSHPNIFNSPWFNTAKAVPDVLISWRLQTGPLLYDVDGSLKDVLHVSAMYPAFIATCSYFTQMDEWKLWSYCFFSSLRGRMKRASWDYFYSHEHRASGLYFTTICNMPILPTFKEDFVWGMYCCMSLNFQDVLL